MIAEAQNAEACRDIKLLGQVLEPVLSDRGDLEDIPGVTAAERAELLRLAGFYLGYYGNLNAKPDFQERGKDLLSQSIDLFESEGLEEEAARARLNLAWRYLQQGSHNEADIILDYTKEVFGKRRSSPVFLRLKLFECVTASAAGEFDKALRKIKSLEAPMQKCTDAGIRAQFHIEAGYVNTEKARLPQALKHYEQAERFAKELNNERFEAIILGNIAFVLLNQNEFARSLDQIEKAIALNRSRGQNGFLAHNFDTKALGFLGLGEYGRALLAIDTSLELFREGDDYAGHCQAIFNKIRILFKLGEIEEALMLFADLISMARTNVSENSARRYAAGFQKMIFYPEGRGYKKEVAKFKKYLLTEALTNSGHVMKDAAKDLKISQAMLSDIVRRQFPEIFDELGIRKRKSRKDN